jgi:hypothetical protein
MDYMEGNQEKYRKHGAGLSLFCDCSECNPIQLGNDSNTESIDKEEQPIIVNEKTRNFIERARQVHGDKYDYSKVVYERSDKKVTIICPIHGEFQQTPSSHLYGKNCKKCMYKVESRNPIKITTEEFIRRGKEMNGDLDDYSKSIYTGHKNKIIVTCKIHGDYEIKASDYLSGKRCKTCTYQNRDYSKNMDTNKFIEKARKKHGDKYDYSKTVYVKSNQKVIITCPIHGDFEQRPNGHLTGSGCPLCSGNVKYTTEIFIAKAKEVHGDADDFSLVDYQSINKHIKLICPIHGIYEITPGNYLSGKRCNNCGIERTANKRRCGTEQFIKMAKEVHGDKYDYSKVEYVNNETKVCIICPEHGEFWQTPYSHLNNKYGCHKCSLAIRGYSMRTSIEDVQKEIKEKYGDKISVGLNENYVNEKTPIKACCSIHGEFMTTVSQLLNTKHGCNKCAGVERLTFEEFVRRSRIVHGNKYIYNMPTDGIMKVDLPIEIICPEHGPFMQTPYHHYNGAGCLSCACGNNSKMEKEIFDFITSKIDKDLIKTKDRSILRNREIDILIESYGLGIEYNGIYWHSEKYGKTKKYHLDKLERMNENGFELIQICEDEYLNNKEAVYSKLLRTFNTINDLKSSIENFYVKEISKEDAKCFINRYDVEPYTMSSLCYGGYDSKTDELVVVMSLLKDKDGVWNITRYSTKTEMNENSIANGIIQMFIDNHKKEINELRIFIDRMWATCDESLFQDLDFSLVETTKPEYLYAFRGQRLTSYEYKKLLKERAGSTIKALQGPNKIWNCGYYKYVLSVEK